LVNVGTALVLVVDDDADTREMYAEFLGICGFGVVQAHDGHAALDAVHATHPDVVVTDAQMPGMDGLELARELAASGSPLPVIFITGRTDLTDALERGGCAAVLAKPCPPQALADIVHAVLAVSSPCERPLSR
jgi:CheY-like chemotaxis protein